VQTVPLKHCNVSVVIQYSLQNLQTVRLTFCKLHAMQFNH